MLKKIISWISEEKQRLRLYRIRKRIKVASLEETIEKMKEGCSISRFGDGEFYIMEGQDIGFQKSDQVLSAKLKQIFQSTEQKHLVCIGNGINPKNYREYTKKQITWMKKNFHKTMGIRLKYVILEKKYYNALISRFWIPFRDKERAKSISKQLKEVWKSKDIVIIEGEKTRMGVGNNLFENVKSCRRILCPAQNAFDQYENILDAARAFSKNVLFLIALGPTATVLAYDLYKEGYQALDIGHIDLEYEWMRLGVSEQINLKDRYVNELNGGNIVTECCDEHYLAQISHRLF